MKFIASQSVSWIMEIEQGHASCSENAIIIPPQSKFRDGGGGVYTVDS